MFKKILIGYDGSGHSERAAKLAGEFARSQKDAQLWLVCVVDMVPVSYGEHYIHQIVIDNKAAGEQLMKDAKMRIGSSVTVHDELLFGGAAESIINVLTKVEGLRVPAKTSSFSFKGKESTIQEIGEKLDVDTILE